MADDLYTKTRFKLFINKTKSELDYIYIKMDLDSNGKISQNGNYNITFPTEWKWSGGFVPNITNTNGKIDIITLIYDGVIFYASILQNF